MEPVPASLKKLKVSNPSFFNMKKSQDHRPYVEACELFFEMQASRFQTERRRILWAMSFLQSGKATE